MLRVNIIGIGPGNTELLTKEAAHAIEQSNILIGDSRMLSDYATKQKKTFETISTAKILEIIKSLDSEKDIVGILVSGDIGFFSLTKTIADKLSNCEVQRFCGISSLVYFAQELNMPWDDAKIISMHGRNNNLVASVAQNTKVFALTGGENSPAKLCRELCDYGYSNTIVYVGENLSYEDERILEGIPIEFVDKKFKHLSVVVIENEIF